MLIERFKDPIAKFQGLPEKLRLRIALQIPTDVGCWLWTGPLHYRGRSGEGYARQWWDGRNWLVHRLTYGLLVTPVPPGLVLDHVRERCQHRHCVRPDHCEPVTQNVNIMRGEGASLGFVRSEEFEEAPF